MESISQLQVKDELPIGKVGQVYGSSDNFIEDNAAHPDGAKAQVSELAITAQDDTEYSYTVEGETIKFTSDGSATKAEIAEGLKAAHEANIIARGVAEPTVDASDNLVLTAGRKRSGFEVSTEDSNLALTTPTEASEESDVLPGRAVWWDGSGNVTVEPPSGSKEITVTVESAENSTKYQLAFVLDGTFHSVEITSSGSASEDGILGSLETALDNLGLDALDVDLDTGPSPSELKLSAATFAADDLQVTSLSADLAAETTAAGEDFEAKFAGVSRHTYDTESDEPYSTDKGPFGASEQVIFLRRGLMVVDASGATKYGQVYIGTEAGEKGQVFASQKSNGSRMKAPKSALTFHDKNILEIKVGY